MSIILLNDWIIYIYTFLFGRSSLRVKAKDLITFSFFALQIGACYRRIAACEISFEMN